MTGRVSRSARIGVAADGWFKLALSVGYAAFIEPLSTWLGTSMCLSALTAAAVAASGVAELATSRTRAHRDVLMLAGYDAIWILASALSWLLAMAGIGAAGSIWLTVQAAASAILATLFVAGSSLRARSRTQRFRK
jgi:hypothetical protein